MPPSHTPGSYPIPTMPAHVSMAPTRPTNGEPHIPNETTLPSSADPKPTSVNRKKQKRRQKQAARLAADRQLGNGHVSPDADAADRNSLSPPGQESHLSDDPDIDESASGEMDYDDEPHMTPAHNGMTHPSGTTALEGQQKTTGRKSKKKKGKKGRTDSQTLGDESSTPLSTPSVSMSHPLPPPLPPHFGARTILKSAKDRSIWNTSTQEERENIKTFWLELGEEERRQLVKVEKDAVLKKMKEQQKHSCSCTVCGRKRTAIEEELEVLYDAYYEELEQYANNNQSSFEKGSPIVPPPRLYQPPLRPPGQHTRTQGQFHPSRGRIHELPEDDDEDDEDEDLEEDYDEDDEDDEPYSDDEFEDEETRAARADFFAFGNSLTVKDGILTVADDLLKNDGKHFIDMMEQLAERRMQREEDTQYGIAAAHQSIHSGHNHGPYDEEDYDDEEEDEDYDSQEDEDYEEDEMDAMTEEQRMEEGRRMFQIFAARMFEQRVLTAYREKVAEQRQQKLIEELMEEQTRNEQRNAKKAREAQKRKDKKKLQKQAKDEEKARRDAEKAAEEAAAKAEHERKLEEQRRKREEQRKKRDAERKAQEDERARKEAEKQRRLREERERQAEMDRKQREQKELEKRKREEARRKEREERELREKKAKEERERKAREEQARKDRETTMKADQESHDVQAKRTSQPGPPIPTSLHHPQGPSGLYFQSPHFPVATPVVPKAPTPIRHRQTSQQGSHSSSPRSQAASAEPSQTSISPRSMGPSQSSGASSVASKHGQHPMLHHPQPSTPLSPLGSLGRSHPPGFSNGLPSNPPGLSGMIPRHSMGHELPTYPPHTGPLMSQLRGFPAPNGIPVPPGMNGTRPMPPGRGFPLDPGHGLPFHTQQPMSGAFAAQQSGLSHGHSRQPSNSFERSPLDTHAQPFPISRPSPIKRPSSTQQDQHGDSSRTTQREVESLSTQLGSSALLDDTDTSFPSNLSQSLPGATALGSFPGPTRASFAAPSLFPDPLRASKHSNFPVSPGVGGNTWGTPMPFGVSNFPSAPTWGTAHGNGWSNNAFGSGGHHRAHTSRPVAIRLLVIQACKQLNTMSPSKGVSGYHDAKVVIRQVDQLRPSTEPPISLKEMLDICDTEGNAQNGGGSFSVTNDETGEFVKFEPDNNSAASGHRGSIVPGEIGSPVPSSSMPAFGGIGGSTASVLRQFTSPPTGF